MENTSFVGFVDLARNPTRRFRWFTSCVFGLLAGCAGAEGQDTASSGVSGRPDSSVKQDGGAVEDVQSIPDATAFPDGAVDAGDAGPADAAPDVAPDPCEVPKPKDLLRIVTYNIHACRDTPLNKVADAIAKLDPDLVGLQEVDKLTERSGHVDQMAALAARTGMAPVFAKAMDYQGGAYGIGLLSRFPVVSQSVHHLPVAVATNEPRVLLTVTLTINGEPMTVGVTHVSYKKESFLPQVTEILDTLPAKGSFVLMGDFNVTTSSEAYKRVLAKGWRDAWIEKGSGNGFTVPVTNPTKRIDYVFLGDKAPVPVCAKVANLKESDHLPVVITLP